MIAYPAEFGAVVQDLSPDGDGSSDPNQKKSLYVIVTDDNPRDFSAPPRVYGAFWSADGPGPVNRVAIGLWPRFGSPKGRDCEENVDGRDTAEGQCYEGSACLDYGSSFLSVSVEKLDGGRPRMLKQVYDAGLLEEAADVAGMSIEGMKDALDQLKVVPWLREEGALEPIYEVFGYPEDYDPSNDSEPLKFLRRIVKWRPEKRSLQIGGQYIVSKTVYSTRAHILQDFLEQMDIHVFGPGGWKDEAGREGFSSREEAVSYAREHVRDACARFAGYAARRPTQAKSGGPWDSREAGGHEEARASRVEVMTKEQYVCYLHNHLVRTGTLQALTYRPPHAPPDWFFVSEGGVYLERCDTGQESSGDDESSGSAAEED